MDIAKDAIAGGAVGFGFYYWITELNPNFLAATVTVFILMTVMSFAAIRQLDSYDKLSVLDTFKDAAVSFSISALVAYAIYAYGNLAIAGTLGGALVAIATFVFLFREDAKKKALRKAGKT